MDKITGNIDFLEELNGNILYGETPHQPKIIDGYWYVWDVETRNYVNTEIKAQGDTGNSGVYIGTEEPTDEDINVWIDTDEQPDSVIGLKYIKDDPSNNGGVIEGLIELPEDAPPSISLNSATGRYAHAEGIMTTSSESGCHAEGVNTISSNYGSHSEGYGTTASGIYSHAEGQQNTSSGDYSHAEGNGCIASAESAHAEGYHTMSQGYASHSEGDGTVAYGYYSHSEGKDTEATGQYSHASGNGTIAKGQGQFVIGEYNIEQGTTGQKVNTDYAMIIGNGTGENARSNAYTLDWNGNGVFAGKVTAGAQPTNASDLTTKQYVDNAIGGAGSNVFVIPIIYSNNQYSTAVTWDDMFDAYYAGKELVCLVDVNGSIATALMVGLIDNTEMHETYALFANALYTGDSTHIDTVTVENFQLSENSHTGGVDVSYLRRSGDIVRSTATITSNGLMSSTDKQRLDDIYAALKASGVI